MSAQDAVEVGTELRETVYEVAHELWEHPELGLEEHESARLLSDILEEEGFSVERGVVGLPTAFVAEYGSGTPVIGILGEYDALPEMSQAVSARKEPIEPGAAGHGCGHNLFAAGSLGGAIGAKRAVEEAGIEGRVRFYGTPAEELGVGKVYMAREGLFDDLSAAISWHPGWLASATRGSCLAVDSLHVIYEGTASHAAAVPEAGRSGLDALHLFDTGIEFMREHVPDSARIHYAVTGGGGAPNVVPAEASGLYYVRAESREEVGRLTEWIEDAARGAAMMTQTEVDVDLVNSMYGLLPNETLADRVEDVMTSVGSVGFDEADHAFADELQSTLDPETVENGIAAQGLDREVETRLRERALADEPVRTEGEERVGPYSTDVGDVSWVVPTAQFRAPTWPVGTPAHSWQAVAAGGDFGREAAVYAARVVAATAVDLLSDPATLAAAREEFEERRGETEYETAMTGTPPADRSELPY
ncbi:amidohydrolase [Natronorarus salvus]|uniref:amidohydrolase n=1 Tax=Natronorarus salvus TaxID=3117733 RepID=UPI002F26CA78